MTHRSFPRETKLFDPADGFAPVTDALEVTDATVVKRANRWWMYLAGQLKNNPEVLLLSASLPEGSKLSAAGWKLTPNAKNPSAPALLASYERSHAWDRKGGRHCPSYVNGFDPHRGAWVERIYYAGGLEHLWGPYSIGYLEWDGGAWIDQPAPVFVASEPWERGSVLEPNLIYADGKWKMWYAALSNQEDYVIHAFSESADGRTGWSDHKIFFPAEEKVFDFCVIPAAQGYQGYEAVFSRISLGGKESPAGTGLWWCHAATPSSNLPDWSAPIRIMTAEDRGWHSGPWKPSVLHSEADPRRMLVFFDGMYKKNEPGPFPCAFTLGCLEMERPE